MLTKEVISKTFHLKRLTWIPFFSFFLFFEHVLFRLSFRFLKSILTTVILVSLSQTYFFYLVLFISVRRSSHVTTNTLTPLFFFTFHIRLLIFLSFIALQYFILSFTFDSIKFVFLTTETFIFHIIAIFYLTTTSVFF